MAEVIDGYAVQQKLIFVIAAAIHLKVVARGQTCHSRQDPDLREKIAAAEGKQIGWGKLSQFSAVFIGFYGDLAQFERLRPQAGM